MLCMKTKTITLTDYKPYPTNPNTHNDYQIGELAKSLDQFEQVKNVVVWKDFFIAGHGLRQAAMASGLTELEAVDVSHWDREKAEKFMIADNRLPELAAIDFETMGLVLDGFDDPMDIPGIDEEWLELNLPDLLGGDDNGQGEDTEPEIDKAEELREKWGTALGQMWGLGEHRLVCGDCTDREVVDRVMGGERADLCLTDPPYGIKKKNVYGGINKTRDRGNYRSDFEDTREFIENKVIPIINYMRDICTAVILTPGNKNFSSYPQPQSFGCFYQPASVGLQSFGNADGQPVFYYGKNPTKKNLGARCSYQVTVANTGDIDHPCPKPLKVWSELLDTFTLLEHIIIDPFSGSGTTLIACQNLGRKARCVEIDPGYCAVTLDRFHQHSNILPVLIS